MFSTFEMVMLFWALPSLVTYLVLFNLFVFIESDGWASEERVLKARSKLVFDFNLLFISILWPIGAVSLLLFTLFLIMHAINCFIETYSIKEKLIKPTSKK